MYEVGYFILRNPVRIVINTIENIKLSIVDIATYVNDCQTITDLKISIGSDVVSLNH
jgi:hypothetical protein